MIQFELQEHLQALNDLDSYEITTHADFSPEESENLLEAAVEAVAESSEAIAVQDVFDAFRILLKHSDQVPSSVMSKLLDSISSGLQAELEAMARDIEAGDQQTYASHKTPMEIYAFLLNWFSSAADKVKDSDDAPPPTKARRGRGGKAGGGRAAAKATSGKGNAWTWEDQIPATMNLIIKVLRFQQLGRVWTTTAERETFLQCLMKPAYNVATNDAYMKVDGVKKGLTNIICFAVKHHAQTMPVQITIDGFLQFYEHLSEPMAECLIKLSTEYNHTQLSDEVLREIAGKSFSAQDSKSPRSFAKFLVKYCESCPRAIHRQFSLLQEQLDSESYPMRQAMIECVGLIITDLFRNQAADTTTEPEKVRQQIEQYYDVLFERTLDLSSYVRVKVFQTLAKIPALPASFFRQRLRMTQLAVSTLEDKLSSVRKAATTLLIQLIKSHPWTMDDGSLSREKVEARYNAENEEVTKLEVKLGDIVQEQGPPGEDEGGAAEASRDDNSMEVDGDTEPEDENGEAENEDDEDDDDDGMSVDGDNDESQGQERRKRKKKPTKPAPPRKSMSTLDALSKEQQVLAQYNAMDLRRRRAKARYYKDCLLFIEVIESGSTLLCQLLGSPNKAEVLEIIKFFETAHTFQIEGAAEGVKKMLHLIWQKDNTAVSTSEDGVQLKGIRQAVIDCYKSLYFDQMAGDSEKDAANRVTKNLIEYTYDATLAELTSLEELLRIMMDEDEIKPEVISQLWSVYGKRRLLPKAQRRGAIIILGMMAVANRSILMDKVALMLKVGLGKLGRNDPTLARYTCVALQRLNGSVKKVKGSLQDKTIRFQMTEPIFSTLHDALQHPTRNPEWFGMAEQAINTVYALAEHPDEWCSTLIKNLAVRAFSRPKTQRAPEEEGQDNAQESGATNAADETMQSGDVTMDDATQGLATQDTTPLGERDEAEAFELSQLLAVVGHVAIKQIVFLELVEREWKRQKDEHQKAEKGKNATDKASKDGEDLDQVVGNAEDDIGDRIAAVREHELLYGPKSLLAVFGPMIVYICGSPQIYKNKTLRAAAVLAFSKLLCVSSQFCDQHHHLLFKILETSKDANLRSNIVIALGDVAVSFSTIIDENSNELYKGLSDPKLVVKKNTLMVLTHLILNGMIKVKGQLGEMAKCLGDPEERIVDLAKLFFTNLSTKDNAIYNNLPDVISHLSVGEHAVDEEVFQKTLKYIFTFIDKDKQAESIVEKLCQRFRLSEDPRQWRDIAFCLSLLPYKSERSVKKLIEGLQYYRDKLHEPGVFDKFIEILNKARAAKGKDKQDAELDDFEKVLEQHRAQGEDDEALEKRVQKKKAAAAKKGGGKRAPRGKKAAAAAAPRRTTPNDDDMYSE